MSISLPSRVAAFAGLLTAALIGPGLSPRPAHAQAPALAEVRSVEGIAEYRLPNGLQVLLAPDDAKPTTTVNLTVRVGSRHENYGETGMAHLLEHLLFKGTPRHPTVWAEFDKRGLRANGTTWLDRTNYFASFAADDGNLEWYLDWLADALVNSKIDKADLATEMTVVRNEMEAGENNPGSILFQRVMATMYQWHNYGKSTIGARSDVEGVDIGRLQAFYRTWYQPDNATLIVSGKFDPSKVKALVTQHFGAVPKPARPLPRLYTLDPVQDGERELSLRRRGGAPQLMVAYHTVPGAHADQAAAELLALVMGDTPAGRLHRALTDKQLASSTWGWTPTLHDPGFIAFGVELAPGQDPTPARAVLIATLEGLEHEPITAAELERARVKWLKGWDEVFGNPEQVGIAISEYVGQGDWRLYFLLRDRVRDIKLADVQRVAAERLVGSNRTLGSFIPTEQPQRAPAPAFVDLNTEVASFKPQAAEAPVEPFDASPANIDRRTERGRLAGNAAGVQYALLPKGARGQLVQLRIVLRGGDLQTFQGQAETLAFMGAMFDKGTSRLSRQQVQDRLDALRATVNFGFIFNEPGALEVSLQTRRDALPEAIELIGQLLRDPAFDAGVLDELKRQAVAAIETQRREPDALVNDAVWRHGNPFARGDIRHARSFDERLADIAAVTPQALRGLHQRIVGASRVELAAVGDFDAAALKSAAARAFGGWTTAVPYARVPQARPAPAPKRFVISTPDKQNATLLVAQPVAIMESDPDFAALTMASHLLGKGGNSRLWKRIRERDGLSYDVYADLGISAHERNSYWQGGAIFAPAVRDKVEAAFVEEVRRALKDGFTPQELAEGKAGLLAQRRLARAQDAVLARGWTRHLEFNRSYAYSGQIDAALAGLTLEQVNAALRKHIDPARWVVGVGGDFKQP